MQKYKLFFFFLSFFMLDELHSDISTKYSKYDIAVDGRPGFVYVPSKSVAHEPFSWVWYAPYTGGSPSRNDFLLWEKVADARIAFAAIDNLDSRGDKKGISSFDKFYKIISEIDLQCNLYTFKVDTLDKLDRASLMYPSLIKVKNGTFYYVKDSQQKPIKIKDQKKIFSQEINERGFAGEAQKILLYGNSCKILTSQISNPNNSSKMFSKKPCLLGGSRGGLMHYSWAVENPEKINCIAGVYPVLDPRSWPGVATMAKIYNMTEQEYLKFYSQNSLLSKIHVLAEKKVPIIHIHGDRDSVASYKDERSFFIEYIKNGGEMSLITNLDGEHDDSINYFGSQDVIDFLIFHSNRETIVKP